MTLQKFVKNQTQKITDNTTLVGNPNTVGTTDFVIYTVPAGKKAKILEYRGQATGFGAGTLMDFKITVGGADIRGRRATALETSQVNNNLDGSVLAAGDSIRIDGDSGADNESCFFTATVQETPA